MYTSSISHPDLLHFFLILFWQEKSEAVTERELMNGSGKGRKKKCIACQSLLDMFLKL